jgi:hypothetical protein
MGRIKEFVGLNVRNMLTNSLNNTNSKRKITT